jgi:hypothetical protein
MHLFVDDARQHANGLFLLHHANTEGRGFYFLEKKEPQAWRETDFYRELPSIASDEMTAFNELLPPIARDAIEEAAIEVGDDMLDDDD